MQQENKWSSPPDTPRNYMPLQSNYPYHNSNEYPQSSPNINSTVLPGISTHSNIPGIMSNSQPNTPRPDMISPPPDKVSPDLIRRRPPLPSRPASFTTTTFHSNPYPNNVSLRRRRTESSMFSFETGPSFSQTKQSLELFNMDQSNGYQIQLNAKMDRGFFRAEQDWTCYRRNYFQVSATFDIHGTNYVLQGPEVPCLLRTENQEIHKVDFFTMGVSARVSGNEKKIELVQHTPKRDKGPQMIPEPRVVSAGGNLHLASVGSNHNVVTFERMQFKTATANNGKRRAAQQYYEIVIDLIANSSTGKSFNVATCFSAPLVVRGRSPGHYADTQQPRYRGIDRIQPNPVSFSGPTPTASQSTPASLNHSISHHGNDEPYVSHPSSRYNMPPSSNGQPSSDFPNPYSSYPPPSNYHPYPVHGFNSAINTPPIRNEEESNHREGYLMHHYSSHPLSSSQPTSNSNHYDPYYDTNNQREGENRYEFNNYGVRSMSIDNENHPSSHNPVEQGPLNNQNRPYLQHPSSNPH